MNKLITSAIALSVSSCSMYEQKQSCHKWYDYSGPVAASLGSVYFANEITTNEGLVSKDDGVVIDTGPERKHPVMNFSIDLVALGTIWLSGGEHLMPDRPDSDCLPAEANSYEDPFLLDDIRLNQLIDERRRELEHEDT